jgi:hypothetical protein
MSKSVPPHVTVVHTQTINEHDNAEPENLFFTRRRRYVFNSSIHSSHGH